MSIQDVLVEPTYRSQPAIRKLAAQTKTRSEDWKLKLARVNQNGIYTATAVNEKAGRSVLFDEWFDRDTVNLFYDKQGIWHHRDDFRMMDDWK